MLGKLSIVPSNESQEPTDSDINKLIVAMVDDMWVIGNWHRYEPGPILLYYYDGQDGFQKVRPENITTWGELPIVKTKNEKSLELELVEKCGLEGVYQEDYGFLDVLQATFSEEGEV